MEGNTQQATDERTKAEFKKMSQQLDIMAQSTDKRQQAAEEDRLSTIGLKDTERMYLNARHGKIGSVDDRTTEEKTASVRKTMRFYKPYQTACRGHGRIDGWYYTEPETIYGECTA